MKKIGILYICTGGYDILWKDFYLSTEKYFLNDLDENGRKKFEKYYFVWTDVQEIFGEKDNLQMVEIKNEKIKKIYQKNLGWPGNTLMRFEMFLSQLSELQKMDFLFFFNANALILKNISELDFLPDLNKHEYLLAALHPGFFNKKRSVFTYDQNPNSLACINKDDNPDGKYFMGALLGGVSKNFLEACEIMNNNTNQDLQKNVIAKFHDESHWNRYLVNRNDIKILGPEYLYPENWARDVFLRNINKQIKMMIRDKEKYLKTNLFSWKNADKNKIKKIFLIFKKQTGDILKKLRLKKY